MCLWAYIIKIVGPLAVLIGLKNHKEQSHHPFLWPQWSWMKIHSFITCNSRPEILSLGHASDPPFRLWEGSRIYSAAAYLLKIQTTQNKHLYVYFKRLRLSTGKPARSFQAAEILLMHVFVYCFWFFTIKKPGWNFYLMSLSLCLYASMVLVNYHGSCFSLEWKVGSIRTNELKAPSPKPKRFHSTAPVKKVQALDFNHFIYEVVKLVF